MHPDVAERLADSFDRLLRRFEACARAHGNDSDVIADATKEHRAALAAYRASKEGK